MKNLLLIFFLTLNAYAKDFSWSLQKIYVEKQSNGELLMHGDCEEVDKHIEAFTKWKKRIGEDVLDLPVVKKYTIYDTTVKGESDGALITKCRAVINSIIPEKLMDYYNITPKTDGPNCWNASLAINKVVPAVRYTNNTEARHYYYSPLCRPLGPNESPEPGDIIANRKQHELKDENEERHGYIFITDSLVLSKNGYANATSLKFQGPIGMNTHYIYYPYFLFSDCAKAGNSSPNCQKWASFYRCKTMDQYLKEKNDLIDSKFYNVAENVNLIERALSKYLHDDSVSVTYEELDSYESQLKDMFNIAESNMNELKESCKGSVADCKLHKEYVETMNFLWSSIMVRAESLVGQIQFIVEE